VVCFTGTYRVLGLDREIHVRLGIWIGSVVAAPVLTGCAAGGGMAILHRADPVLGSDSFVDVAWACLLSASFDGGAVGTRHWRRMRAAFSLEVLVLCAAPSLSFLLDSREAQDNPHANSMWRRFSPFEERSLRLCERSCLTSTFLSMPRMLAFTLVQRLPPQWLEISFIAEAGKVDWIGSATFPRPGEVRLAEVQFSVEPTLQGHTDQ